MGHGTSKIVAGAKAIFKPEVSITGPISVAKEEPEGEEKKLVVQEESRARSKTKKEKPIIFLVKESMAYKKRKPLIKNYWKVMLPIAGLALIGFLLKGRE